MKETPSHEMFSIRRCENGCVVMSFGHTTVHLDARHFEQFSEVFRHFAPTQRQTHLH